MSGPWSEIVFSEDFMKRLDYIAGTKIVGDVASKEEAVTYVIEKLSENDWERCKAHNGGSSKTTYLYTLASNLIIEYSRRKFGRARPPEWLKREGPFWEQIWREICLDRNQENQVVDRHCSSGMREPSTLKQIIRTIKAKLPWCGVSKMPESLDDEDSGNHNYSAETGTINDEIRRESYDQFLLLAQLILTEDQGENDDALSQSGFDSSKVCDIVESLQLTAEEQLMLRMFFLDGLSHSAIARSLNVAKHIPARQTKKVLLRLREALAEHSVELA